MPRDFSVVLLILGRFGELTVANRRSCAVRTNTENWSQAVPKHDLAKFGCLWDTRGHGNINEKWKFCVAQVEFHVVSCGSASSIGYLNFFHSNQNCNSRSPHCNTFQRIVSVKWQRESRDNKIAPPPPQWTLSLVTWITLSPTETCSNHVELRIIFFHNLKDSTLILHQFVCVCVLNVTSRNSFWNWVIYAMSLFNIEFLEILPNMAELSRGSGSLRVIQNWCGFWLLNSHVLRLSLKVAFRRCAENFDSGTPQCQILAMISSQTNSPFRCHMSWNTKHPHVRWIFRGAETRTGNPQCPATMQSKTSVVTLLNSTFCPSPALHRPLKTENLPNLHRNWILGLRRSNGAFQWNITCKCR